VNTLCCFDLDDYIQVTGRAAVDAGFTFAGQADAITFINAGRDFDPCIDTLTCFEMEDNLAFTAIVDIHEADRHFPARHRMFPAHQTMCRSQVES